MAKVKLQLTVDKDLTDRMDAYAKDNHISRSGLVSIALAQFLNAFEMRQVIYNLGLALRKIADDGKIDSDSLEKLKDFERAARLLSGEIK